MSDIRFSLLALNNLIGSDKVKYANFNSLTNKLKPKSAPRILLLQGPVGPFFKLLQTCLNQVGFDTWRICFTSGDKNYSNREQRIIFSEGLGEWPSWFDKFLSCFDVDCIMLFGCERPVHSLAIEIAKRRNIPIISLEEGYIRPGYITVENGGNNRRSPLSGCMPPKDYTLSGTTTGYISKQSTFSRMCWFGAIYYGLNFFSNVKQKTTYHKNRVLISESYYWSRNLYRKFINRGINYSNIEKLLEHYDKKYFLVVLQVADDVQMKEAARGWTNEKLIKATLTSFAKHASKDVRLVYKIHPLERGHSRYDKLIDILSVLHDVKGRVDIIDTGSVGLLVRHATGMITINSTSGLSAIAHTIPLMVTGESLYSNTPFAYQAITQQDIDKFWTKNFELDRIQCQRYLAWLKKNSLKSGDYYTTDGIIVSINSIIMHLRSLNVKDDINYCSAIFGDDNI